MTYAYDPAHSALWWVLAILALILVAHVVFSVMSLVELRRRTPGRASTVGSSPAGSDLPPPMTLASDEWGKREVLAWERVAYALEQMAAAMQPPGQIIDVDEQ